jgi:tetratricopeptide (TPR) repeat protein/NAD-dependent dihydropyrimidine dehydrogenase PreA subunit
VSYTIVADVCEGLRDCIPACPADCIHPGDGHNAKGTPFVLIDPNACTNCGICVAVCPIEGAVLNTWQPELQTPQSKRVAPPGILNARRLELLRDVAGAAAAYQRVYEFGESEKSAEAAYRFGRLLGKQGDTAAALRWYRRGLAFAGSRYEAWCAHEAAAVLHGAGDLVGAVELYRRAMDCRHGERAAIAAFDLARVLVAQGDVTGAVWAYRGAIGCADSQHSPAAALELAKLLEQRGDTAGAVTAYKQVFRFAQRDLSAKAALQLGHLHHSHGDADAAIAAYQRGLKFSDDPDKSMCALSIAAILAHRGEHSAAIDMYRLAMDSPHPDAAAPAAFYFGEYLVRQGDSVAAMTAFERAIGHRHHEFSAKAALALGTLMEGQGNPVRAAGAYWQILDFGDTEQADEARGRLDRLNATMDPRSAVRDAVVHWRRTHYGWGSDEDLANLADRIAQLQAEYCELELILSHDLSETGGTFYAVSWLDELHSFELSPDQARQLAIEPDTFSMQGIGGSPRTDSRHVPPDVYIERLRFNDGAPLATDEIITVAANGDARAPLPPDVRLRIGWVVDGTMRAVLGDVIHDISADEVLRADMGPLSDDGWLEGPVPIFVDLVVIHDNSNNGGFTVISNTLTALADLARTSRTVGLPDLRRAAQRWCASVMDGGRDRAQALVDVIEKILLGGNHFALLLPADLTKRNTAYFAISCAGGLFALPMRSGQAAAAGLEPGRVRLTPTAGLDAGGRRHIVWLRILDVGGVLTSGETMVGLWATCHEPLPSNVLLRITYTFVGSTGVSAQPADVPTDGVLVVMVPNPQERPQPGPMLLAMDLCVPDGAALSPVSNTVVSLLDVPG